MNPRRYVVPARRTEFFGIVHQILPVASGAVQSADTVQVDGQSEFLIYSQSAIYQNGQEKVKFTISSDTLLMDAPIFISNLGSGQFPLILPAPFRVPKSSAFTMLADDRQTVAASNNIRVLHAGLKEYDRPFSPALVYQRVEPFELVANFTADDGGAGTIAANGAKSFSNLVSGKFDFDIYKLTIIADGDATVNIQTSGKALTWFNRACHIALLGATQPGATIVSGAWPFRLPRPVHVPAGGTIVTDCADLGTVVGGGANRVQVCYWGLKLFPPKGVPVDEQTALNLMRGEHDDHGQMQHAHHGSHREVPA